MGMTGKDFFDDQPVLRPIVRITLRMLQTSPLPCTTTTNYVVSYGGSSSAPSLRKENSKARLITTEGRKFSKDK